MSADIFIRGKRVGLGPLRMDLLDEYARWANSLDVRFTLGWRGISTPETIRREIEDEAKKGEGHQPETAAFTVYDLEDETPVGSGSINAIYWVSQKAKLGLYIGARRGQGLGTEATELLVDWAFTGLGLHNLVLECFAFNEGALRVYRRVGFREIGRRRGSVRVWGARHDEVLMDITADDWKDRAGTIGTWSTPTPTTSSASPPVPPPPS